LLSYCTYLLVDARGLTTPLFLEDDETSEGDDGIFDIGIAVWNSNDVGASTTTTVTIANVVPSVTVGVDNPSPNEGDTIILDGTTFSDAGVLDIGNTAGLVCGDGSSPTVAATVASEIPGVAPDPNAMPAVAYAPTTGTVTGSCLYADDESDPGDDMYDLVVSVTDKDGGVGSNTLAITVNNVDPSIVLGTLAGATINESDSGTNYAGGTGSFSDPGADTWTATVDYGDGGGPQALTLNPDNSFTVLPHLYTDDTLCGDDNICNVIVTVTDDDLGEDSASVDVTVNNVAPTASTAPTAVNLNDGDTLTQSGSFTDPGVDTWDTSTVDYGEGAGTEPLAISGKTFNLSNVYESVGVFTVTVTVTDDDGESGQATIQVTVTNALPEITDVSCTSCAVDPDTGLQNENNVGTSTDVVADFTDADADTHTATIDWGDGAGPTAVGVVVDEGLGTISGSHVYSDIGPYIVTVTVDDGLDSDDDNSLTVKQVIHFEGTSPITDPVNNARFVHTRNVPAKFIANDETDSPILGLEVRLFTQCTAAACIDTGINPAVSTQAGATENLMEFNVSLGGYSYQMDISGLQFQKGQGITHDVIFRIFVDGVPFDDFAKPIRVT